MGFFDNIKKKMDKVVEKTTEQFSFNKIKDGLEKTRKDFVGQLRGILGGNRKIDDDLLDEIEDLIITSDIGVNKTEKIIDRIRDRARKEGHESADQVFEMLKEEILAILVESPTAKIDSDYSIDESKRPHSIMVIGVNGVGKTTTIGKLAYNYKRNDKKVLIGAADTFRAAANEQLDIWAERAGVPIIQQNIGADPAAVAYDTLKSAMSKDADVVIIDTAGRLHNKANLMNELSKINRVMGKLKEDAPDEVFLVLDATTGQNAIFQAKEFSKVARVTGIILTKLDGTAKGGVVIPIADELKLPVRYIGVGEKIDDLQIFDSAAFVAALFGHDENNKE